MEKISYLKTLLNVFPIKLLEDNYSYLIVANSKGMLVDPALSEPILNYLQATHPEIQISHILVTHKHWDHAGEIEQLLTKLKSKVEVIAGEADSLKYTTISINKITNLEFEGNQLQVIPSPCHTKGHLLYYLNARQSKEEEIVSNEFQCRSALFTGDTLFIGGCGRFFEGNGEQMLNNFDIIAKLPPETKIFCGHEYTVSNLEWASKVDTSNSKIKEKLNWAMKRISQNLGTIPSTVESELETNVFMRCRNKDLQNKLDLSDPIEMMDKLRQMKNQNLSLV